MKYLKSAVLFLLIVVSLENAAAEASKIDPVLEKLTLSGFLRLRGWNTSGRTKVPDFFVSRDSYKHVFFADLFFRSRIGLNLLPEIKIQTVFDISAKFGKGDFAIGEGDTNLITRDIYAIFRPVKNIEISAGLRPFSLPGGYIIARDATGLNYRHRIFKQKLLLDASFIMAFDDADDSFGQGSDQPDYVWDYVYIAGLEYQPVAAYTANLYYVHEDDRFVSGPTSDDDVRKANLHWVGLHNKIVYGRWLVKLSGIYNQGKLNIRNLFIDYDSTLFFYYRKNRVRAWMWEFEATYSYKKIKLGIVSEGGSGDPTNSNSGTSFQDIKASHGYTCIAVDNTGGLAIRGSGESSWYGLYSGGVKFQHTLFDSIIMELMYAHFRTVKRLQWRGKGVFWYGDECNLRLEYKQGNILSVFFTAAGFLPQRAYSATVDHKALNDPGDLVRYINVLNLYDQTDPLKASYLGYLDKKNGTFHSSRSMLIEIMLGVTVSY